jgi:hypothetical protein
MQTRAAAQQAARPSHSGAILSFERRLFWVNEHLKLEDRLPRVPRRDDVESLVARAADQHGEQISVSALYKWTALHKRNALKDVKPRGNPNSHSTVSPVRLEWAVQELLRQQNSKEGAPASMSKILNRADRKSLGDSGMAHVGRELKLKALRGALAALRDLPGVKRLKNNVHTKARAEAQEDVRNFACFASVLGAFCSASPVNHVLFSMSDIVAVEIRERSHRICFLCDNRRLPPSL